MALLVLFVFKAKYPACLFNNQPNIRNSQPSDKNSTVIYSGEKKLETDLARLEKNWN